MHSVYICTLHTRQARLRKPQRIDFRPLGGHITTMWMRDVGPYPGITLCVCILFHFFKCWEFLRALLGSVTNTGESEGLPSPALGLVTPHLGALVVMSVQEAHHHHPGLL